MGRNRRAAMITVLSERRNMRMRRNILKGVLEENLRILGRGEKHLARSQGRIWRKAGLSLALALLLVIFHGSFLTYQWFPEGQMRAGLLARQAYQPKMSGGGGGTLGSEEVQALVGKNDVPLWRLLGMGVKTIMIDPGHGGKDSGAVGARGTMEKDLVLDIARRLKEKLVANEDYRVIMTREDDVLVPLNERVKMARRHSADLFISIHLNYLPQKPINIIETFYFGPSEDEKTDRLAEKENAGSEIGLNNFKALVEKLNDELKLQESQELAVAIQGSLYSSSRRHDSSIYDYGIKQAPFVVLLGVDVPSVLVEVSCLSNTAEEEKLNTEVHRENIARYLESGILAYLKKGKGELRYDARR
jgi:N-acetylmuramoyl-L-alanine amidase